MPEENAYTSPHVDRLDRYHDSLMGEDINNCFDGLLTNSTSGLEVDMPATSTLAASEVPGVQLHLKSLLAKYPALTQDADDACWDMLNQAKLVSFDAHTILFHEAMECHHLMLIVDGRVRVYKNSSEGREVTLYRVEPGQLCVHNLNNLVNGLSYPIMAQTETEMQGLVISRQSFQKALDESITFRNYVLRTLTERLSHMVDLVSGFAFDRLDLRIACWLNQQYEISCGKPIEITHSELAQELGTTREMVSRILKEFEHKRCIQLARGKIHLQCRHTLKMVSQGKGKSS